MEGVHIHYEEHNGQVVSCKPECGDFLLSLLVPQ